MRAQDLLILSLAFLPLLTLAPRAAALTPQLAITPEQLSTAARRHHIPAAAKLECAALDTRLPRLTQVARRAKGDDKASAAQALHAARERYTALRC